ncbi:MAG TPA: DUF3107 domain-containing protein [Acidimicrobiales bacterium]|nr:DUF3107 domain-containing protein [Acidimicrobiales bacterium]
MDLRIGLTQTPRELEVQLPDDVSQDAIRAQVDEALAKGGTFWISDKRGRQYAVDVAKVAYVEIGSPEDDRRIGFGG